MGATALSQTFVLGLVFASAFLLAQVGIGAMRQATRRVAIPNYRLRLMQTDDPQAVVLSRMRRARGLDDRGQLADAMRWLAKVVLHSGLRRVRPWMVPVAQALTGVALGVAVWLWKLSVPMTAAAAVAGVALPVLALLHLGRKRRSKAVSQLPEALDIIVRSLGAGHPVPVAMRLVGREMPDPLGSEFGTASDEIGFGSGVAASCQRLAERIDHEDVHLFAAMIRLQERTGGNLADLLRSNAKTIRNRQTMRLRIKAASAEGRISAVILNVAPLLVFAAVRLLTPDFYGDVAGHPWLRVATWGVAAWMVIGNLVMRRMINFRI